MRLGWLLRPAFLLIVLAPFVVIVDCGLLAMRWRALDLAAHAQASARLWRAPDASLLSPASIVPPWPLLPFHAVLRAIPSKVAGIVALAAFFVAPLTLAFRRWSTTPLRAWASLLALLPIIVGLGWAGGQPPMGAPLAVSQALTALYFLLLLVVFPSLAATRRAAGRPAR